MSLRSSTCTDSGRALYLMLREMARVDATSIRIENQLSVECFPMKHALSARGGFSGECGA